MATKKPTTQQLQAAAAIFGRIGGSVKSETKARAVRKNGKKGGWWKHKDNLPAAKKSTKPR